MIPYIKLFADASATVDLLSDAEAGRLIKALLHYSNGVIDDLPGQEKLVFAMLKSQIDRDAASYHDFCDKQRENGKKGGRPKNPMVFEENPKNPSLFSETQKSQDKEKDKDKEEDNRERERDAREEMPFGLTDEDVHETLKRNEAIEEAATSAGLPMSEASFMEACELARVYGLDKLLQAIKNAALEAQHPTWKYVRRMLDGKNQYDRGNNRSNRKPRTEYTGLDYTSV